MTEIELSYSVKFTPKSVESKVQYIANIEKCIYSEQAYLSQ